MTYLFMGAIAIVFALTALFRKEIVLKWYLFKAKNMGFQYNSWFLESKVENREGRRYGQYIHCKYLLWGKGGYIIKTGVCKINAFHSPIKDSYGWPRFEEPTKLTPERDGNGRILILDSDGKETIGFVVSVSGIEHQPSDKISEGLFSSLSKEECDKLNSCVRKGLVYIVYDHDAESVIWLDGANQPIENMKEWLSDPANSQSDVDTLKAKLGLVAVVEKCALDELKDYSQHKMKVIENALEGKEAPRSTYQDLFGDSKYINESFVNPNQKLKEKFGEGFYNEEHILKWNTVELTDEEEELAIKEERLREKLRQEKEGR